VTICVMVLAPRITKKVPAAILGLFAGIISYFILGIFNPGMMALTGNNLIIGPIQSSASFTDTVSGRFSSILQIRMDDLKMVIYSAMALSVLLSIDTLKTCVVLDALTKNRHNSNRELFGQGIANLASFASGGMAGAGTMGPTLVNVTSGGRKPASGIAEGILVILAILALSPLIAWVPIAALAGILLVVAFNMFEWSAFGLLKHKETRFDFAVIAAVVIVAETMGLIQASATGIGLAILLFIRDQIRGSVLRRKFTLCEISSKTQRLESEREILKSNGENAAVVDLQGNLFFGTTDQLFTELDQDLKTRKWMLFDLRRVQSLDYTAAHLFTLMEERLDERGGDLLFCGLPSTLNSRQDLYKYMKRVGLISDSGIGIRIFETRDSAIEWMENQILEDHGWLNTSVDPALDIEDIELLRQLDQETIDSLKGCIKEMTVKPGEKIFSQGDQGDEIFLLRRGVVRILLPLRGGKFHHLATFIRGDYFGEMAFLDKGARSADAVAKTECELYMLSREEFNKQVYQNPVMGVQVFARLALAVSLRLRETDIELRGNEDR
ncbi:MAG: SLC26A/SulP transporter family protein, partial [Gammaproteobacteria bacterium]|nr:SLC26A/SulP transporter family protein [Gammaproteobacteria bacterium]